MSVLWVLLLVASVVVAALTGRMAALPGAIAESAGRAVTLSLLLMACISLVPGNLFGLLLPPALALFWAAWGLLCMRKIGGMTGDTMGAGVELSELFCLILVRAFFV